MYLDRDGFTTLTTETNGCTTILPSYINRTRLSRTTKSRRRSHLSQREDYHRIALPARVPPSPSSPLLHSIDQSKQLVEIRLVGSYTYQPSILAEMLIPSTTHTRAYPQKFHNNL
ncbi:unnamed protein product [Periconia digitata]|uniref:Uncharacterized protein n=1 Tax=Periconia digitata TaxID=1303443 RepID=A0A9W4XDW6_9PLEO|nr:unnamed protein product [Periconia digitata]